MNMRAGGGSSHGMSEGNKRDADASQIAHQCLSLDTIGAYRDVYRVAVIEAQVIVHRGLPVGAYG